MPIVRELLTEFGVRYDDRDARKADQSIGGLIKGAQTLLGVFAGSFVVRGLSNFITDLTELGDSVAKTSAKLGIGVEALQELEYAAQRSGQDVQGLRTGLQYLAKNAGDAAEGTGEAKDAFRKLGVVLKDSNGNLRPAEQLIGEVADRMAGMSNETERVQVAMRIFGRSGVGMINMLKGGAEGLEQLRQEARDTGGIISAQLARDAEHAADAMLNWDFTMQGLRNTLGASVLPFITRAIGKFTDWVRSVNGMVKDSKILEATMIVLGAAGAAAAVTFLGPWLPLFLKFGKFVGTLGLIILALDELLVLFDGGETLIGEFLDTMGGLGTAQTFVDSVRTGWALMGEAVEDVTDQVVEWGQQVGEWFTRAADVAEELRQGLVRMFGPEVIAAVEAFGSRVLETLLPPLKIARELAEALHLTQLGQDIASAFSADTFNEQRSRQRTEGQGVGAAALAGPEFGIANAARPQGVGLAPRNPPRQFSTPALQAQGADLGVRALRVAPATAAAPNINIQGGDVIVQGNADRGTAERIRQAARGELDKAARSALEGLRRQR